MQLSNSENCHYAKVLLLTIYSIPNLFMHVYKNITVARGGVERRNALRGERVGRRAGNQWASE